MTKIALVVFLLVLVPSIQIVAGRAAGRVAEGPQADEKKEMFMFGMEAILHGLVKQGVIDESKIHEEDFAKAFEVANGKEKDSSMDQSLEEEKVLLYTGLKYYIQQLANKGLIDRDAVEKKIFHVLPGGGKIISLELDSEVSDAFEKAYTS